MQTDSHVSGARPSKDSLLQVVREFGQAWAKGDLATLERFLANEYVHTDIAGHFMRRAAWLEQASRHIEQLTISFRDLDAAIYGDVGVVTGANDISGGAMPIGTIRFTQVWVWRDQKWQRLAFQATRAAS